MPRGTQEELLNSWAKSINNISKVFPANKLYCGRGFSEILQVSDSNRTDLFIISAGLGFVSGQDNIPSYNLTVKNNTRNSIADKCIGNFNVSLWWSQINKIFHNNNYLFASTIKDNSNKLFVVCLSATYASLIENDLVALAGSNVDNIRIIGLSAPTLLPYNLRRFWMPYDERFDGQDSPNPGTRSDFPQRATKHFIETIVSKNPNAPPEDHSCSVVKFLESSSPPQKIKRQSVSDDEVAKIILNRWDDANGNCSRMLRILRDEELIACEQSRFASIFRKIKARLL